MPRISIGGTRELTITTDISGQSVIISGQPVTVISGQVDILNMPPVTTDISGQPVTVSGDIVRAEQYGAWGVQVSGAVIVSGDINASQAGTWNVGISGSVTVISGQVDILNMPSITTDISGQAVWVGSGEITILSGDVRAQQLGTWDVGISGSVTVISGQVDILNMPSITTDISGQAVWVGSGEITILSGDVRAQQLGTWDVSVSGTVTVISGLVSTSVSGNVIDIVTPSEIKTNAVANASGNPVSIPSMNVALVSNDCISVTIKALSSNSGDIYIGGYTSGQTPNSGFGLLLEPGEAINIDIDNIGKIHVYAVVSGDKVTYIANK